VLRQTGIYSPFLLASTMHVGKPVCQCLGFWQQPVGQQLQSSDMTSENTTTLWVFLFLVVGNHFQQLKMGWNSLMEVNNSGYMEIT